jgi:hypothetical protein
LKGETSVINLDLARWERLEIFFGEGGTNLYKANKNILWKMQEICEGAEYANGLAKPEETIVRPKCSCWDENEIDEIVIGLIMMGLLAARSSHALHAGAKMLHHNHHGNLVTKTAVTTDPFI